MSDLAFSCREGREEKVSATDVLGVEGGESDYEAPLPA